jgi:CHASE2 domain-containing sensor protein
MKKPLHKHIGHHVRRAHQHFTKYLYERDTIFATLWVFIFIIVLGSIPLNLYVNNPFKLALKDFDFNDIYYSNLKQPENYDSRVVIVNIGILDREGLSYLIDKTASFQPKTMGLDATLSGPKDPYKDSLLYETIKRNKNLVLASRLEAGESDTQSVYAKNYFTDTTGATEGYVNFFHLDYTTIRFWNPFWVVKDESNHKETSYKSFTTALIEKYDPAAYQKLEKKGPAKKLINYTRKLIPAEAQNNVPAGYQLIQADSLMNDQVDTSLIRGKIVLLGYVNVDNPIDIEDKLFTPMNPKFAGKSIPDMNGIVIHANIISMVLDKNYIKKVPSWVSWLVAILVGWLHMSFFIRYYLESHIWFHLVAKIAQVASAIFFVWLGTYVYSRYHIKLDMKMTLVVIVMAVDVIYFYEAWAVWMHKKFKYHTVFHHKHHD